jgi:hypothetical protein
MKDPRRLLSLAILSFIAVLIVALAVPNYLDSDHSEKNSCINNLRLIEGAKREWAVNYGKANSETPTWEDIKPYLVPWTHDLPKCPSGGAYTLGAVSNVPTCSIPAHVLPPPSN